MCAVSMIGFVMLGTMACQSDKANQDTETANETVIDTSRDRRMEELEKAYQKKIDSLLALQSQGNTQYETQMAAAIQKAEELAARNKNLDSQIGAQEQAILRLQDSLLSARNEQGGISALPFQPVALTEGFEEEDTTTTATEEEIFIGKPFEPLLQANSRGSLVQEVDSLIREVEVGKGRVAERDERLDDVLSQLAVGIVPKSKNAGKEYEEVIINTLLATVADDTLITNQYKRGFYTKQDLNALIGDYKLRKQQKAVPGELVVYRRKKKEEVKDAVIYVDDQSYPFGRNEMDTIQVKNVFDVKLCDRQGNCTRRAFSKSMVNYVEVSRAKKASSIDIKPVNQVFGEFYARQVATDGKDK